MSNPEYTAGHGGSEGAALKQSGGIKKRELFLHCLMQWLSMQ